MSLIQDWIWSKINFQLFFFRPVLQNSIPKELRIVFKYDLLLGSLRETANKNADRINLNLHNLASNEGILKTAVNKLIKQSNTILTNSKTEENSILSLNIKLYFDHLVINYVHELEHLLTSVADQQYIIPFIAFLTEHKF